MSYFGVIFQLTTSHRGRRNMSVACISRYHFNSLPHTEVDQVPCLAHLLAFLFQLTTSHRGRPVAPAWTANKYFNFNSLPHTEVDNVLSGISMMMTYFNSLPHTEVDCSFTSFYFVLFHFNSLPHTEVDGIFRSPRSSS